MIKKGTIGILAGLCAILYFSLFSATAKAQDFYGEGNVLIAVDMGPYEENENVDYPEGTMGNLVWGADAPIGVSTRAAFNNRKYDPVNTTPVKAPDYETEVTYEVGQKVILPFYRDDDPDINYEVSGFTKDELPAEVFKDESIKLLINRNLIKEVNGETYYGFYYEKTDDGNEHPCADFLEIECVAVTQHCTIWRYTGKAYSNRTGFDIREYMGAVDMTSEGLDIFEKVCEEAYVKESEVYCDPLWEDYLGDRDKKAAFVALGLERISNNAGFFGDEFTEFMGFDCIIIDYNYAFGPENNKTYDFSVDYAHGSLIHELNHYIVTGGIGHESEKYSMWTGEALAESAIYLVEPDSKQYLSFISDVKGVCSRIRMIPGVLWTYDNGYAYPNYNSSAYSLGAHFLRYIERETTGKTDGRLWTEYFSTQVPDGNIKASEIDSFLKEKTGEGIDAWLAQFMAAVVVGADDGLYSMGNADITDASRIDKNIFFRSVEEYGKNLGTFNVGSDPTIIQTMADSYNLSAIQGGGTTYAFRNDAGGRIAITGADERWYFFAVNMELPSHDVIEISSAEELSRIGEDMYHPLSARYILTSDIDLGGEEHPWTPIGGLFPFSGEFDGNGYTISGLYINAEKNQCGLFYGLTGNAIVHDLTVSGSVTCCNYAGGIAGKCYNGSITQCTSNVTVTGEIYAGGIVGYAESATITDCNSKGSVSGQEFIGAITGGSIQTVLQNNHYDQKNICETGVDIQSDDINAIVKIGNDNGTYSIVSCKENKGRNCLILTEVKVSAKEIALGHIMLDTTDSEYTPVQIARNAFKNVRAEKVAMKYDVKRIRKDAFNGAAISELSFIVYDAGSFKVEKDAFRNMKKMRNTTVIIYARDKGEYRKAVSKLKKAGGDKLNYEFRVLEY